MSTKIQAIVTEDKNCVGSGALNLGIPPPICGEGWKSKHFVNHIKNFNE